MFLSLHYIDTNFDLQAWTIDCKIFEESQSDTAIKAMLDETNSKLYLPSSCEIFDVSDYGPKVS